MAKELAIVCNNGSLNSVVTTALAAQKYRLILLHLQTDEPNAARGHSAYEQQVSHFKPYRETTINLPRLTPATNERAIDARAGSSALVARMVNLLPMIAIAARLADHYRAKALYTGFQVGLESDELATVTEYFQIWHELFAEPCALGDFELVNPLLELEAWQVVDVGMQVNAPFDKTWSCFEQGPDPCWACKGCGGREAAFTSAGKHDPLRAVRKM